MNAKNRAAITPPKTGEITQLAAIFPMFGQFTAAKPAAAIPAPMTPPTTECVVETGAPTQVAKFTQSADEISAAIMAQIKISESETDDGSMIPFEIVDTTSPPAKSAPAVSQSAAMTIAPPMVSAFAPTAGPMLLATSFAPMLTAIYAPTTAAATTMYDPDVPPKKIAAARPATTMNAKEMPSPTIGRPTYCAALSTVTMRPRSLSNVRHWFGVLLICPPGYGSIC